MSKTGKNIKLGSRRWRCKVPSNPNNFSCQHIVNDHVQVIAVATRDCRDFGRNSNDEVCLDSFELGVVLHENLAAGNWADQRNRWLLQEQHADWSQAERCMIAALKRVDVLLMEHML